MSTRISSLDKGYIAGDLSIFPAALDTQDTLFRAANNAETVTKQGLTYNSKFIVVEDASIFPPYGLIKVGTEIVYYGSRTNSVFNNLSRGYGGTRQNPWPKGTKVANAVMADTHNALKDAVINIESDLGLKTLPVSTSLNGILTHQEARFLAPQPLFRGFPTSGSAPLTVSFQNLSGSDPIRYLWDFGDGSTSVERSPSHVYTANGKYTVKLSMVTSLGAQGAMVKENYITIADNLSPAFFYATPVYGVHGSTTITFIDQTNGDIASRYWIFDDGTFESVSDPDVHTITHKYNIPGKYTPSLLVIFTDDSKKKLDLQESIVIT